MSLSPPMQPFNSADPSASFLSTSALDFLLIELVPLAHRVTSQRDFSSPSPAATSSLSTQLSPPANHQQQQHPDNDSTAAQAQAQTSSPSVEHPAKRIDDDEHLDAVHYRLEAQGYRVGQGLVERCLPTSPTSHTHDHDHFHSSTLSNALPLPALRLTARRTKAEQKKSKV